MTGPSTPLDLDAIRRRWDNYKLNGLGTGGAYAAHLAAECVPDLLAEVERLRAHSVTLNSISYRIAEALDEHKGEESYVGDPAEQADRLIAERDEALAEVERLRTRIHEAVDECQRRYAPMQAEHDRMANLLREASRRHGDEMEATGKPRWSHISGYGQATAAAILAERDEARSEVERLRGQVQRRDQAVEALLERATAAQAESWRLRTERDELRAEVVIVRHGEAPPRTWAIPDEPGPEVTAVRDVDGDVWRREGDGWALYYHHGSAFQRSYGYDGAWADVMAHGPLVDVTAEMPTEAGDSGE